MSFRWELWCKWFSWLRMQHFFEFLKVSFRSTLCLGELLSGNGKRYSCHLYVFQCIIIFSDNKIDSRESENACVNSAQCSKTRKTFSFFFFYRKARAVVTVRFCCYLLMGLQEKDQMAANVHFEKRQVLTLLY